MALTTYHPSDFAYGIALQSTWGTAIADDAAFVKIYCQAPDYSGGLGVLEQDLATGARVRVADEYIPHNKGILWNIGIPAMIARQDEMAFWLYLWFQQVTETQSGAYKKVFTLPLASQPDFTVNAGCFVTFCEDDPISGTSRKWKDCICSELVISCNPGEYMMVKPTLISRAAWTAATISGTWTPSSGQYWHYNDIDRATYNFGSGLDYTLAGPWELNLSREVVGFGADGSGGFTSLLLGKPKMTLKVTAGHGAVTATTLAAQIAGTQGTFRLGFGNATAGSVDGDFDITGTGKVDIGSAKKLQEGEATLLETIYNILAADASTAPITVTLADAVNWSTLS